MKNRIPMAQISFAVCLTAALALAHSYTGPVEQPKTSPPVATQPSPDSPGRTTMLRKISPEVDELVMRLNDENAGESHCLSCTLTSELGSSQEDFDTGKSPSEETDDDDNDDDEDESEDKAGA
jgi:hypothetical protein